MKIWKEINLVDDQKTLKKLSHYSLVILIACVIISQVILDNMQAFYQFTKAPLLLDIKRIFIELNYNNIKPSGESCWKNNIYGLT